MLYINSRFFVGFMFCILSVFWGGKAMASGKRISLKEPLLSHLNQVLEQASVLHEAAFDQNVDGTKRAAQDLKKSLQTAEIYVDRAGQQKPHVLRVLKATESWLEQFLLMPKKKEKQKGLQEAFRQLVQFMQVYNLKEYPIFFCSKDKSLWFQKSGKANHPWTPRNPIHPTQLGGCGSPVANR